MHIMQHSPIPTQSGRVLIVDNQPVTRAGLRRLLESYPDVVVVGEAVDGVQAVSETLELGPQVVILDAQLPQGQSLEALRQIHRELERDRTLFVHLTLLPYVGATGELKTKPTQHSVKELRSIGIQPDVICARSDYPVPDDMRDKIALFCDVDRRAVVPLETADTIYSVPLILEEAGLGDFIVERLGLGGGPADLDGWRELVHRSRTVKDEVEIGVVGKYVELQDAYISVREAIYHAACRFYKVTELSPESFSNVLAEVLRGGSTEVDLLIRTGGEQWLSDFLLWECAFAEFVFLPKRWPDLQRHSPCKERGHEPPACPAPRPPGNRLAIATPAQRDQRPTDHGRLDGKENPRCPDRLQAPV